jgi:hypothetical protein
MAENPELNQAILLVSLAMSMLEAGDYDKVYRPVWDMDVAEVASQST